MHAWQSCCRGQSCWRAGGVLLYTVRTLYRIERTAAVFALAWLYHRVVKYTALLCIACVPSVADRKQCADAVRATPTAETYYGFIYGLYLWPLRL